ncbi:MAG: LCP family protein [bacterium]
MIRSVKKQLTSTFESTPDLLLAVFIGLIFFLLLSLSMQSVAAQFSVWNIEKTNKKLPAVLQQMKTSSEQTAKIVKAYEDNREAVKKQVGMPPTINANATDAEASRQFTYKDLFNILIVGKNGGLTDTMIIVTINEKRQEITTTSIPRDLYYGGRKINSYYEFYGMNGLKNLIETLTGLTIQKYAMVDMMIFVDVINRIGGVDVCLDAPLTDNTYKTIENGQTANLHFDAGCHHVNGTQALRLARSRYSSSDFKRSERQQQIIKGLQERATKLSLADLSGIGQSIITKLDTDIQLPEGSQYYFKYKNYKLKSNNVMSTANALTSTTSPDKQYILLPRDNQWYKIKKFFFDKINE